ncbi:MAG TPA: UxaA family hydrolase, partial [Burkholderiaceae bacterium]|nr:UxaA family hydrolase [Burkholderiaceae bacterium]
MRKPLIQLHPLDNVAVARVALPAGSEVQDADGTPLPVRNAIAAGHKIALRPIAPGEVVLKYGQVIGLASAAIAAGEHVHVHNVQMGEALPRAAALAPAVAEAAAADLGAATFEGFVRADGSVGTRNYLGVMATVNCSATVCKAIAQAFAAPGALPGVDGVVAITHGSGCGMSDGEGLALLRRTLRGYAAQPNFAAVLLVGLGCEVNQLEPLLQGLEPAARERVKTLTIQDAGGTREAVAAGQAVVRELAEQAGAARRSTVP